MIKIVIKINLLRNYFLNSVLHYFFKCMCLKSNDNPRNCKKICEKYISKNPPTISRILEIVVLEIGILDLVVLDLGILDLVHSRDSPF